MRASFSRADGPACRRSLAASRPSRQEERHDADPIRAPQAGPLDLNANLDRRDVLRPGLLGGDSERPASSPQAASAACRSAVRPRAPTTSSSRARGGGRPESSRAPASGAYGIRYSNNAVEWLRARRGCSNSASGTAAMMNASETLWPRRSLRGRGTPRDEGTATQDAGASCDAQRSCSSQTRHHARRARAAGSYLPDPRAAARSKRVACKHDGLSC